MQVFAFLFDAPDIIITIKSESNHLYSMIGASWFRQELQ